jgi:hypothetical protein
MHLLMRVNGQKVSLDMERAGDQTLTVGEHRYQPARLARRVRKLATKMWGDFLDPDVLDSRFYFEAVEGAYGWSPGGEGGNFSPSGGASVALGVVDESSTVGIALHMLAHELHYRSGGYEASEVIVREAVALLAEREGGLARTFEREPYYTASNLADQLYQLRAFRRQPFRQRWEDLVTLTGSTDLADTINYYLDRSEGLGLSRWLQRYSQQVEVREQLLQALAICSLRYSLEYRRILIRNIVRCSPETTLDRLLHVIDAVMTLDRRYPNDDIGEIIDFCFAPLPRPQRKLLASG